mmetsp:Transcript_8198/g.12572  ORF Transcript_8198/g.12572 Transcript_8198/m.12572 type:complete len:104 (+) Transcript_8198:1325-1636(+)
MYFDANSRFLACYGEHSVNVIPLMTSARDLSLISTVINVKEFSHIVDIQLVSEDDAVYRCDIAVKLKNMNNIIIYDINEETINRRRNLTFLHPLTSRSKVKIS